MWWLRTIRSASRIGGCRPSLKWRIRGYGYSGGENEYSNQTSDRAGKTDKEVIEIRVPKSGAGDRQVAEIRNELDLGRRSFPVNFISTISNLQTIVIE
jgi:hypothetical protein